MTAIDWMLTRGDCLDHVLAVQWNLIPDGNEGGHARMDLVREFSGRFARARIAADGITAIELTGMRGAE